MAAIGASAASGPVWDPIVRVTHWATALAITVNGLITEGGSTLHLWVGYSALALLVLRLLWGVIGPEEARFSSFPPSVAGAVAHVRDLAAGRPGSHRSHNPAGSLMVYALWAMLGLTTATGVFLQTEPFPVSSAAASLSSEGDGRSVEHHDHDERDDEDETIEFVEETHELAANLLLILAALHVAGVAVESRLSGRNLVRAMIDGAPTGRSGE